MKLNKINSQKGGEDRRTNMTDSKTCKNCNKVLGLEQFYNRYNVCKTCVCAKNRIRYFNLKGVEVPEVKPPIVETVSEVQKICRTCNESKSINEFNKKHGGRDIHCRICTADYQRRKYNHIGDPTTTQRVCGKCTETKCLIEFRKSKKGDKYFKICNDCWAPRKWNKEKQHASEKKYMKSNSEKIKEKYKRQNTYTHRRIRLRLNRRIRAALSGVKTKSTLKYTGCSLEYLKKWFEFHFTDKIRWDNMREWHIDHVLPCSSFDLSKEEEQMKCFNWKNLRPCLIEENIEKRDKIIESVIEKQNELVNNFIKVNPLPTHPGDRDEGTV